MEKIQFKLIPRAILEVAFKSIRFSHIVFQAFAKKLPITYRESDCFLNAHVFSEKINNK